MIERQNASWTTFGTYSSFTRAILSFYPRVWDYHKLTWTVKGLSHTYTCIHSPPSPLPSSIVHNTELSSMCYIIGFHWLSTLNIAVCTWLPNVPNHPFPLATMSSFSKSVSLFLFCKYVLLYHFFLDSTYKGCHMIFLLLPLTLSVSMTLSGSVHVAANGLVSCFLMAE